MRYITVAVDNQNMILDTWLFPDKVAAQRKLHQDFLMMIHLMSDTVTQCTTTSDYARMTFNNETYIEWFVVELSM